MDNFNTICESALTTIKQTKIMRYPKQIQLSDKFIRALRNEVERCMQIIDDSQQPIRDLQEKFLKALRFEITEISQKKKV